MAVGARQADIDTYIKEKKSVVDGGLLGPNGHIGWYIPDFVAEAHPEYKTWEGLKSPAAAKYFATAETGDKGQFLLGDPSYVSATTRTSSRTWTCRSRSSSAAARPR